MSSVSTIFSASSGMVRNIAGGMCRRFDAGSFIRASAACFAAGDIASSFVTSKRPREIEESSFPLWHCAQA